MQNITFFKTPAQACKWFRKNHDKASELWVGFYNAKSGKASAKYKEVLDEAPCFGWIDGIRKNVDPDSYMIRFTPRKNNSIWSNVNTRRIKELIEEGRVQPSGLKVFNERNESKVGIYSFEQEKKELPSAYLTRFKANKKAWKFFISKAPWYQRTSIHWVMNARQQATRLKRLEQLIADSENERTLKHLTRDPKK